jgi:hypothetical protein
VPLLPECKIFPWRDLQGKTASPPITEYQTFP